MMKLNQIGTATLTDNIDQLEKFMALFYKHSSSDFLGEATLKSWSGEIEHVMILKEC